MKKYILILLFSISSYAQAQVVLPDHIARFYLEQNEKVKLYEKQIVIKNERIENLQQQVKTKDVIIGTFKNDSATYEGLIKTHTDRIAFVEKESKGKDKEIRAVKRQRNVIAGAGVGAIAGSVFGQPILGAGIGGVVGLVVSWIKK